MKKHTLKRAVGLFTATMLLSTGLFLGCASQDTGTATDNPSTDAAVTETVDGGASDATGAIDAAQDASGTAAASGGTDAAAQDASGTAATSGGTDAAAPTATPAAVPAGTAGAVPAGTSTGVETAVPAYNTGVPSSGTLQLEESSSGEEEGADIRSGETEGN